MAYSSFNIENVKETFGLSEKTVPLFENTEALPFSDWLKEALDTGLHLAFASSSEKARSEFIVVPILFELQKRNNRNFTIYSGERLTADPDKGLDGECDFILSKGEISHTIQIPIVALAEAKKHDIETGLGQCAAQMMGARIYNQKKGNGVATVFGCVTTGETWQFLKLEDNIIYIDRMRYYINEVGRILRVWQNIIDFYNN